MDFGIGRLWAGTEESLHQLLARIAAGDIPDKRAFFDDDDDDGGEPRRPRLLTKQGNVGVVAIRGSLVNSDSWLNEIFGLTGYPEIRNALVTAAQDEGIESILLDIDSGGGAVSGMSDVSDLIRYVDRNVKPVAAHTGGMMASAAYALGSSARHVSASRMADVGSIGVLLVHREMSRLMERSGITNTVMRAGEFKALGNPFEPLSDKARAEIQSSLDYSYLQFKAQVAEARGVSVEYVGEHMAEGRVFTGEQARSVNLVDEVCTYDEAFAKAFDAAGLDKTSTATQYRSESHQRAQNTNEQEMKLTLNPMTAAAQKLAAEKQAEAAKQAQDAAEAAAAAGAAEGQGAVEPKTEGDAPQAGTPEGAAQDPELVKALATVDVLRADRADLQTKLAEALAKVERLQGDISSAASASKGLRAIADQGLSYLRVALNLSHGAEASLTDEQLLAEHSRLQTQFDASFKAGGVAAVTTTATAEVASENPAHAARMRAARINK